MPYFSPRSIQMVRIWTKIDTFTFYKGGLGAIAPRSQRNVKKMEAIPFLHQILHTRRINSPVMMRILQRGAIHPLILNLGKGPVVV